ncbi:MAG TPA: acyltransferase [Acidimicrobiia bacterium]
MRPTRRLAGFDGLRAIAALSIVVYHVDFYHLSSHRQHALLAQLRFGVWVFFALSGFLLYRGWANAHLDGKPAPLIGEYFRNRVLRIYPAYWMALIFFVAIHDAPLNATAGLKPVIEQFTLTQVYTTIADTFRGLPQTWSLAVEVSFYLALPLYALATRALGRRYGRRAEYAGFAALVVVWLVWTTATRGNAIDQQWLPNFTMAFGVGVLMAVVATDSEAGTALRRAAQWLGAHAVWAWIGAALALVLRSHVDIAPGQENALESQLFYAGAAVLLVAPVVFAPADWLARGVRRAPVMHLLDNPVARFLGRISYGIFLWHFWIVSIAHDHWFHVANGSVSEFKLLAATLPVTIGAATLSWYVVERPILHAGRVARGKHMAFRAALAVITFAALAWRVLYVLAERGQTALSGGDAFYYHWQANAVAKGLGFIDPYQWQGATHRIQQSAEHPPAYVLYLAAFSRVGLSSATAHRLASCLLGAGTVFVLGLVGRALTRQMYPGDSRFPELVGLIAAIFAAAYANLWINDEMLMSESMAGVAIALVLLAIIVYHERPTLRNVALLGGAIAFAAMSRAELLALSILVIVPIVWWCRTLSWRERIRQIGVAALVMLVIIMPWIGYNLSRFNRPVYMSTGLGGVTLSGNCNETYYGAGIGYWSGKCDPQLALSLAGDESDREVKWRTHGLDYMRQHLSWFPVVAVARAARIWGVYGRPTPAQNVRLDGALEGRGMGPSWLAFWQYAVLMPIAIAGLVLLRKRRVIIWPFLVIAALATFTAMTSFGITRYRVPVDVMLPVLAAVTIAVLTRAYKLRPRTA